MECPEHWVSLSSFEQLDFARWGLDLALRERRRVHKYTTLRVLTDEIARWKNANLDVATGVAKIRNLEDISTEELCDMGERLETAVEKFPPASIVDTPHSAGGHCTSKTEDSFKESTEAGLHVACSLPGITVDNSKMAGVTEKDKGLGSSISGHNCETVEGNDGTSEFVMVEQPFIFGEDDEEECWSTSDHELDDGFECVELEFDM